MVTGSATVGTGALNCFTSSAMAAVMPAAFIGGCSAGELGVAGAAIVGAGVATFFAGRALMNAGRRFASSVGAGMSLNALSLPRRSGLLVSSSASVLAEKKEWAPNAAEQSIIDWIAAGNANNLGEGWCQRVKGAMRNGSWTPSLRPEDGDPITQAIGRFRIQLMPALQVEPPAVDPLRAAFTVDPVTRDKIRDGARAALAALGDRRDASTVGNSVFFESLETSLVVTYRPHLMNRRVSDGEIVIPGPSKASAEQIIPEIAKRFGLELAETADLFGRYFDRENRITIMLCPRDDTFDIVVRSERGRAGTNIPENAKFMEMLERLGLEG